MKFLRLLLAIIFVFGFAKPNKTELKKILTPLQYKVTQEDGTEKPFDNKYWNHEEPGIYVDIVSGEPLFSSLDKYKSGSGWPAFTKPLISANITYHDDHSLFNKRTEVRSKLANSHLGHVFSDGPKPTGKRYCINSAAMRFVPASKLKEMGYGQFATLFTAKNSDKKAKLSLATFAGGCFWCMEKPFDDLKGVKSTTSGYSGGTLKDPTYEQVSSGGTGHAEVVQIEFDPSQVSYEQLLEIFWKNIDPTVKDKQFCDSGSHYRSAIFFHDEKQRKLAQNSLNELSKDERFQGRKIFTKIEEMTKFYPAEDYHQNYYLKNPIRYKYYRNRCGRDSRLKEIWGL